jgi:hypothetical protein
MAYACNGSQILRTAPENLFLYPFTMNIWAYRNATGSQHNLILMHNVNDAQRFALFVNSLNIPVMAAVDSTGVTTTSITSVTVGSGSWFMMTGVFTSATNRTVYFNASSSQSSTISRNPNTPSRMLIGGLYNNATTPNLNGSVCEAAVWNESLTSTEINSLYNGAKASLIRPQNLRTYYPLIREVVNHSGTHTINDNTGTIVDHYRRYG